MTKRNMDKKNIKIIKTKPNRKEIINLINELDLYQKKLYPPESNHLENIDNLSKSNVIFIIAKIRNKIVGCGAVKNVDNLYGELKRIYVLPEYRGQGIGRLIIEYLENDIKKDGINIIRLETGIYQKNAILLYTKMGYKGINCFGDYKEDKLSIFMEKNLSVMTAN